MFTQIAAFQGEEHQAFMLSGGRPAALLIHGFPGSPAEMRPVGEALHNAGWTTQGLLLPGFGPDIASLERRRLEDWQAAVAKAMARLRQDHPGGFSPGGFSPGGFSPGGFSPADSRPDSRRLSPRLHFVSAKPTHTDTNHE